jgi:hypothetical protein
MTADRLESFRRVERVALIVAIGCAVVAAILAWFAPHSVVPAWRLAAFVCLQPALGSLIFVLIHRLTGGQWAHGLAPFLLAGTRLLPWVWVLTLPLLWFPVAGHPREPAAAPTETSPPKVDSVSSSSDVGPALEHAFASGSSRRLGEPLRWYFSRPLIATRAAVCAIAFFLLALGAPLAMRATTTLRWFGPLGLIGLVFLLHLLATDWIVMLDPGWYSTGFPLVWIAAQAIAGIALAIAAAVAFGAEPSERGDAGHVRGLDWGNLMLASIMVWAYVAFVQLLIIWSGNLPPETAWYRHRAFGAWRWLSVAIAVIEFGGPFFLLLSRGVKRRRRGLGLVTLLLLLGQSGYTTWLIAPAFPDASSAAPWLLLAATIAAFALFINRYLAGARAVAAGGVAP